MLKHTILSVTAIVPFAAILLSTSALAEEWKGSGEFGAVISNGNSDSEVINAGLRLEKITPTWEHKAQAKWLQAEDDGDKSADSFLADWRTRYNLDKRQFAFANARYFDDEFDSFDSIKTVGAGYGYRIFLSDMTQWEISGGVGYRQAKEADSGDDVSGIAFLGYSDFNYNVNEATRFYNEIRIEATDDNTFSEMLTGLSVDMTRALALKLGYEVRHNSDVEDGDTNTDTLTSVNVSYQFF